MSLSVNINPEDSPLARFAYELRTRRLEAGLTQRQFARRIGFSASQVAMVETLRRNPDELFAIACDKEFGLKDHFVGMRKAIKWEMVPEHYRDWRSAEEKADEVHIWTPMLISGLFQTEAYARSIFEDEPGITPEEVDAKVHRRMQRQKLLTREKGPLIVSLLDEGVLHRPVGSRAVMREQLDHLLKMAAHPRVTLRVVPYDSYSMVGLAGGFSIAFIRGAAYVVYVDSSPLGRTLGDRDVISRLLPRWNALQAAALPVRPSICKIAEMRDTWT
jgi:transcriptional regulator with XRE-family HTH domain